MTNDMKADTLKILEKLITDNASREEIEQFIWDNFTARELVNEFITSITEVFTHEEPQVIRITEDDFKKHFRIIGFRSDGTPETRGSKRWSNKEEED